MSGGVVSGEGYCPLPMVENDPFVNSLAVGDVNLITLQGAALDQILSVELDGNGSVSVASEAFGEVVLSITPNVVGDFVLTLECVCGELTYNFNAADITRLIPGDGTTDWVRESANVSTANGTLTASSVSGWNKGASFGTVPAGSDFQLSFQVNVLSNAYGMIGVDNSDPNFNYTSIDYCLYFANGGISVRENGSSRGAFGSASVGDTYQIKRTGSTITYHKNNSSTPFYTSNIASNSSVVFDCSIYRNTELSGIEIWYLD